MPSLWQRLRWNFDGSARREGERGAADEGDGGVAGVAGPTEGGRGGGGAAVGKPRVPTHAEVCARALHPAARSGRRLGVLTSAVAAQNPAHTAVRGVTAVDASTTTHAEVRAATTAAAATTPPPQQQPERERRQQHESDPPQQQHIRTDIPEAHEERPNKV
ncbi:uncharacterized protein LOC119562523 [Drosophila subpulchrella]|uniref:uncharacterized protein LOC119562523 n=1 Tax=Drosophila subpulchrella TaxID=1486046 RepID=UPI0018A1B3C5|nr:uncharacterized protein LOC119562523 [Drosophila subpulchrella]